MGQRFASSFESSTYDFGWDASSGSPALVSTPVRDGIGALEVNAASEWLRRDEPIANGTSAYQRVYIRTPAAPTNAVTFLRVGTATTLIASVELATDLTLILRDANGAQIGSPSAPLAVDTHYDVELLTELGDSPSSSNGTVELTYLEDEVTIVPTTVASSTTADLGAAAIESVWVGNYSASAPGTSVVLDAYALRDDTWAAPLVLESPRQLVAEGGRRFTELVVAEPQVLGLTSPPEQDHFELVASDYIQPYAAQSTPLTEGSYCALSMAVSVNDISPDTDITVALYSIASVSGPAGEGPGITLGSQIGTAVTVVDPSANSMNQARHTSAEAFAIPADGFYTLVAFPADTMPPDQSTLKVRARLWVLSRVP